MVAKKVQLNLFQLSNNICLFYTRLVDDIHQRLMNKALAAGHKGLKLSHALILPQISTNGTRIIDIAKSQGVSKQAIGQIANELELLGYIERFSDSDDKRSKKLILSRHGIELIRQSAGFMNDVEQELNNEKGVALIAKIKNHSHTLFKTLHLKYPDAGQYTPGLAKDLPLIVFATSIANHLDLLLQEQNIKKGHQPLKRSYWHILEKITADGIRINDLAELNGISKQAVSQLANEIEKAGYISRLEDPSDKRAKQLFLSGKGEELITHTLESTRYVEAIVEEKIGTSAFRELKECLHLCFLPAKPDTPESDKTAADLLKIHLQNFIVALNTEEQQKWLTESSSGKILSDQALLEMKKIVF